MASSHQPSGDGVAERPASGPQATSGHLTTVDACTIAAARATSKLAHLDAARHLQRAVALLIEAGEAGTATHFELAHAVGRARWRAGEREAAAADFDEAWRLADRLDDAEQRARSAIGGGFSCDFSGPVALARAERCRTALEGLPAGDGAMRARLMADLAASLAVETDRRPAQLAAAEAREMARRVGEPIALGYALVAEQFVGQGPTQLARRLADAREIISLAAATGEHPLEVLGRFCLVGALLEAGDPEIDAQVNAQAQAVRRLGEPGYRRHDVWFRCMRALLRGSVDEAEQLAEHGFEVAAAASDPDAFAVYGGQLAVARWIQGRSAEMETTYHAMRRDRPDEPLWTAVLAGTYATTDRLELAAELIDEVRLDDVPDDQYTLLTYATLAEAACRLEGTERMRRLYDALAPYAERMVPIAMGVACWGPVARVLGLLALRLGDVDEGLGHLDAAIDLTGRLAARPWLAEAELDLVEAQLDHGRTDERTALMLEQAATLTATIGMPVLAAKAAVLRARLR